MLKLKSAWRDDTSHIKMSSLDFMRGMAAQVLRPRLHLICVHGVMAPNAGLHAAIVPGSPQNTSDPPDEPAHGAPSRMR